MKIAYVTTCSKRKRRDLTPLSSMERYLSKRIKNVYEIALKNKATFYILSGKYGLIDEFEYIDYYDKILHGDDVNYFITNTKEVLRKNNIAKILYFTKDVCKNLEWQPYFLVIEKSCKELNIELEIKLID